MADTVDPLGGSYYVEALTDRLEAEARAIMRRVEDMGGAVAAIETGYMQTEIAEAAARYQREVDSGERIVVGVNAFTEGNEESGHPIFRLDPWLAEAQRARLARFRQARNPAPVGPALERLRLAARAEVHPGAGGTGSDFNLMEPILDAVKAYATLGEICGVLRDEFGEYHPPAVI